MRLGNFFGFDLVDLKHRLGLREQFVHRILAGAGHRLIGRDHDALDLGAVVQRLERDDELRGRAVRIGDDAALAKAGDRVGIDLRHDQRHVGIVPPARRIIDHHRAGGGDLRRPFLGYGRARRHQADIDAGEVVMLERFDLQRPVAIGHFDAHAAARGERHDLVGRERPLGENIEHFAADIAGRPDDCDGVTHRQTPSKLCRAHAAGVASGRACRGEMAPTQCRSSLAGDRLTGRNSSPDSRRWPWHIVSRQLKGGISRRNL